MNGTNNFGDGLQARPDLTGSFGMCASTHWLASSTAQSVLERGGNAFDAAVAAAFVLHVVEPHQNGPGGDLVALVAPAGSPPRVLVGQGPAPRGATIEHYHSEGLDLVPGAGALAAAVPGAVDAWLLLLRDHGTWELSDALEYAVHYATTGHHISPGAAQAIAAAAALFRDGWPTSAQMWLGGGQPPQPGQIVRLFLSLGGRMWISGLALGSSAMLILGHLLGDLLYGVSPTDGRILFGTGAFLGVATLLACLPHSLRASRMSPIAAINSQ